MSFYDDIVIYSRTGTLRTDHLNSFAIFDLRLEQDLLDDRLRLYFGVDNFTDEESELTVAFPQPGRSYYGGVDLRF
jgi:outer membrane receptor protein involved in Fe transport